MCICFVGGLREHQRYVTRGGSSIQSLRCCCNVVLIIIYMIYTGLSIHAYIYQSMYVRDYFQFDQDEGLLHRMVNMYFILNNPFHPHLKLITLTNKMIWFGISRVNSKEVGFEWPNSILLLISSLTNKDFCRLQWHKQT